MVAILRREKYMNRLLVALTAIFLLTGCVGFMPRHYANFHPKCSDCIDMPRIALVPLFDSSNQCLDWNISYEITLAMRQKILDEQNLFLLDSHPTFIRIANIGHMSLDETCAKIRPLFGRACYVCLIDIIQHDIVPYERQSNPEICCKEGFCCNNTLMMKARLTILDVQKSPTCIILEEIVSCNQTIPKEEEFRNYKVDCWGSDDYADSPIDKAHRRLAEVLAHRIQDIVWND